MRSARPVGPRRASAAAPCRGPVAAGPPPVANVLATDLATSSSSDPRDVSLATRLVTTSRISVSRRIVSVCLDVSRLRRRSAPSWMAVARTVASSSICLAWALAVASVFSASLVASLMARSVSSAGRVAHLVRFGPGGRDRVLRLLLRGGQHPLGLLARLGAEPVGFLLGVLALLADLVLGAAALGLGLVVGELQDLADPLADLLMGRLAGQALPRRGELQADPFGLVERLREPLLQITGLAAGARDELIHLAAAVARASGLRRRLHCPGRSSGLRHQSWGHPGGVWR